MLISGRSSPTGRKHGTTGVTHSASGYMTSGDHTKAGVTNTKRSFWNRYLAGKSWNFGKPAACSWIDSYDSDTNLPTGGSMSHGTSSSIVSLNRSEEHTSGWVHCPSASAV